MQQEYQPSFFDKLMRELRRLCNESQSGTLFITTEENHAARFVIKDGAIVGVTYRTKHGLGAIPFIKSIKGGTYTFSGDRLFLSSVETSAAPLPSVPEIFRLLGISLETLSPAIPPKPAAVSTTTARPQAKPIDPAPVVARVAPAKKILLVEDSTVTRKLIAKILVDGGYAVVEAENGLAAFAQLEEEKPDLMLLDVVMPGIDGYKVLSMVRKHDTLKNLPIIMLTSRDSLLDKLRGRMGGSDEYLTKPFTAGQLLEKIGKYLSR
ncbi:MAG: response regulator [Candidatus Competibacteraceae bacterium]